MSVSTRSTSVARRTPSADGLWPVVLCWLAVALDGFDLVVIGAVIPTISKSGDLGFTDASLTTASTMGLVGVGIGAVLIGPVTDRLGRRVTLISCIAWFSVLTIAVAFAPNVETFVILRLLAGLGLGACLPIALTFMSEYSPAHRNGTAMTRVMTGYHVGAVITALLALWVIDAWGWQAMFVVGGVAGLLVLPFMWARLPESETFLEVRQEKPTGRMTDVLTGGYLRVSLGLWVASFMGLLLVYGLNTWLPKMMGDAGYSIKAGTGLLLLLNLGAVIGLVVAGTVSDARGNKPTVLVWFGLAALFLALLSIKMQNEVLVYAAVLLTGIFVFSAQVLVYAFVGHLYPPEIRGTALGLAAGIGRVGAIVGPSITGALVTAGIAYPWGFYVFAGAALLAVLALATVPAHLRRAAVKV
ncbi:MULTISPECIES: MFS transporter [unclassified Nocardioides]|uniref:MFS transporter n=1 Tax=unclassified Nocardioides TaxID=2615069 RepID=UPI0009EFA266|nr:MULTISPECIES: aromatic acid/H+ symport family MFS transporter [unclassified Nocardioides]GAW50956.1 Benzoate MFS transporter BenK [Nocardioides sp. PD653-B2]GAW56317.1 Benzoate MFS transporter BenK [Nocardioides sp. PD653]